MMTMPELKTFAMDIAEIMSLLESDPRTERTLRETAARLPADCGRRLIIRLDAALALSDPALRIDEGDVLASLLGASPAAEGSGRTLVPWSACAWQPAGSAACAP